MTSIDEGAKMRTVNGAPQFEGGINFDPDEPNEALSEWAAARTCVKCRFSRGQYCELLRIGFVKDPAEIDSEVNPDKFSCAFFKARAGETTKGDGK